MILLIAFILSSTKVKIKIAPKKMQFADAFTDLWESGIFQFLMSFTLFNLLTFGFQWTFMGQFIKKQRNMSLLRLKWIVSSGDSRKWSGHRSPGSPAHSGHPQRSGSALHQQQNLGVCATRLEGNQTFLLFCYKC